MVEASWSTKCRLPEVSAIITPRWLPHGAQMEVSLSLDLESKVAQAADR
jgi:hypothetical protein